MCDINMPKLNGFDLRAELLNSESSIKNIPFVYLSTSNVDRDILHANELKVQGYYNKSNSLQGIKETVEKIINLYVIK